MTTYFDEKMSATREVVSEEQIEALERAVLDDMILACEAFRGDASAEMPAAIRHRIYQTLRASMPAAWHESERYGGPEYQDLAAHLVSLRALLDTLHSLFHAAARVGWPGGDSPTWPRVEMHDRFFEAIVTERVKP